jgi:hypothetical protein
MEVLKCLFHSILLYFAKYSKRQVDRKESSLYQGKLGNPILPSSCAMKASIHIFVYEKAYEKVHIRQFL